MVILRLAAFAAGFLIVAATLRSALRTFVLPRSAPEKISRFVFVAMRRLFNLQDKKQAAASKTGGDAGAQN